MAPLPVVVCGKNPNIAKVVKEGLLPEYEVVLIVTSAQAGASEIPLLLSGQTPAVYTNPGSGDFSKIPVAVCTGGGYDDETFNLMRNASKVAKGAKTVPWLRPDLSKLADGPPLDDVEAFGRNTAERLKKALGGLGLSEDGEEKEEWKTDVYYY